MTVRTFHGHWDRGSTAVTPVRLFKLSRETRDGRVARTLLEVHTGADLWEKKQKSQQRGAERKPAPSIFPGICDEGCPMQGDQLGSAMKGVEEEEDRGRVPVQGDQLLSARCGWAEARDSQRAARPCLLTQTPPGLNLLVPLDLPASLCCPPGWHHPFMFKSVGL